MAWTAPITWVDNDLVTAALMNTHLRDNLNALKTPPGIITVPNTNFDTSSTSYVDVTNAVVTFTTAGGSILIIFGCTLTCTVVSPIINLALQIDGGADITMVAQLISSSTQIEQVTFFHRTAISAGSHTIKVRMKVNGSTGRMANATSSARLYACEMGG